MAIVLPSLSMVPSFFIAMLMSEPSPMRKTARAMTPKITGRVKKSLKADMTVFSRN